MIILTIMYATIITRRLNLLLYLFIFQYKRLLIYSATSAYANALLLDNRLLYVDRLGVKINLMGMLIILAGSINRCSSLRFSNK